MIDHRDQERFDRLEKKIEDGFAAAQSEAHADFRLLITALLVLTLVVMILGFAAIIAAAGN
jgi:hypothetical protein